MKPHDDSREPDAVPEKTTGINPDAGIDSEVGDLEDEDDEDALPGRAGGGLAGG